MIKKNSRSASKNFFSRAINDLKAKKNALKSTKKSKKRQNSRPGIWSSFSFTTKAVVCLVASVLTVAGIVSLVNSQISISKKQKILDDLNTQIARQQVENEELEQQLNGSLDEYIEAYARDKLDMVKPGERVYINTAGE